MIERIKDGWTPEQIGNRMIQERAKLRVCQETIYRYIYSRDGMRDDLWWYLPTHRVARRPRRMRKRREPKFHRDVSILFRPPSRDIVAQYPVLSAQMKRSKRLRIQQHYFSQTSVLNFN